MQCERLEFFIQQACSLYRELESPEAKQALPTQTYVVEKFYQVVGELVRGANLDEGYENQDLHYMMSLYRLITMSAILKLRLAQLQGSVTKELVRRVLMGLYYVLYYQSLIDTSQLR